MARRKRRNHLPTFKAQVLRVTMEGNKTLAQHANHIKDWKMQNMS